MSETNHLLYESGVYQKFQLEVRQGSKQGTYDIEMPDGFEELDLVVNLSDDFFNVDDFILGDTFKLSFLEYSNPTGFEVVRDVYDEFGGDGEITFRWLDVKNGVETDLLGGGYMLNLNKYRMSFDSSVRKIETEIKKKEAQNKLLTREDVSINLFDTQNLDQGTMGPLPTLDVYYKGKDTSQGNFYFYDPALIKVETEYTIDYDWLPIFAASEENELGSQDNPIMGTYLDAKNSPGPFIKAEYSMPRISVEISNMDVRATYPTGPGFAVFSLVAIKTEGSNVIETITLANSTSASRGGVTVGEIVITNASFEVGSLSAGQSLDIRLRTTTAKPKVVYVVGDDQWSIEVKSSTPTPLRKTVMVRAFDALSRLVSSYTGGEMSLKSDLLGLGGAYYNTGITTGVFLRGVGGVYLDGNKMTTSFKNLFYDSLAPLMALGFDLQGDEVVVEGLEFFFSDEQSWDFSDYDFARDDFALYADTEQSFNHVVFGSKRYSTNNKNDLLNYNTVLEATTPLRSVKTKFDKTVDAILDGDAIQELADDKSASTNDRDDDLAIVDLVLETNFEDNGVLPSCVHSKDSSNRLELTSYIIPFDTMPISVGNVLEITSGYNAGSYTVHSINGAKITLTGSTPTFIGSVDTPVSYVVASALKNRTTEGFSQVVGVRSPKTSTNLRHNPKYQMARWYPFFGSGLNYKTNDDVIKVTDYKNNGGVLLSPSTLSRELHGNTVLNANESLGRLRSYKNELFSAKSVEVTLLNVTFETFLGCFYAWRLGGGRGYITVPYTDGVLKVHPFGNNAFKFNGSYNELAIKGRVRATYALDGKEVSLTNVSLTSKTSATFTWGHQGLEFHNGLIQYSLNRSDWTTIGATPVVNEALSVTNMSLPSLKYGDSVFFRIVAETSAGTSVIISNIVEKSWVFDPFTLKDIVTNENYACGKTSYEFELEGNGLVNISLNLQGTAKGTAHLYEVGSANIISLSDVGSTSVPFTLSGTHRFRLEVENTYFVGTTGYTCLRQGCDQPTYDFSNVVGLSVESGGYTISRLIEAYSTKYEIL